MKKEAFISLAKKYYAGECSTEERTLYEKICHDFINHDALAPTWNTQEKETTRKKILAGIAIHRVEKPQESRWLNPTTWWMAASVLLVAGIGLTFYFTADKEVRLQYLTKSTTHGQRLEVTLQDGSVVILNSKSTLSYPEAFSGNTREVILQGEAFFKVQKNAGKPFIVRSGDVTTTVLGTSFNVRAFEEASVEVTVATGKVKVAANKIDKAVLLTKGQQAVYNQALSDITTHDVELKWYTAWISRSLEFDMMPFNEVIKILARTYNTEIRTGNRTADKCLIRGKYENETLPNVLKGLRFVVDFDYHLTDYNVIIIDGKGCIN